uniref:Transmembrane protein 176B n=1 Tax=Sciurus vulgaris TaxID=55149 RepID=A0A8D2CQ74_SCIVU
MTQNTVTVNGVDVASTLSQPTHIDIHIHQESALAQLLKAGDSLKQFLSRPRDMGPSQARISNVRLALGAIAAGAGAIVHEKSPGRLSGWVSGLLALAGIATAVAVTVLCVSSLIWQSDGSHSAEIASVCDSPANITARNRQAWRSYHYDDWREESCRSYMKMMMKMFLEFCSLLAVVCILKVLVALASLGLCLRSVCGQSSWPLNEEGSEKKLLGEFPPSKEKTPAVVTL